MWIRSCLSHQPRQKDKRHRRRHGWRWELSSDEFPPLHRRGFANRGGNLVCTSKHFTANCSSFPDQTTRGNAHRYPFERWPGGSSVERGGGAPVTEDAQLCRDKFPGVFNHFRRGLFSIPKAHGVYYFTRFDFIFSDHGLVMVLVTWQCECCARFRDYTMTFQPLGLVSSSWKLIIYSLHLTEYNEWTNVFCC